jgi:hypothetical protein
LKIEGLEKLPNREELRNHVRSSIAGFRDRTIETDPSGTLSFNISSVLNLICDFTLCVYKPNAVKVSIRKDKCDYTKLGRCFPPIIFRD